MDHSRVRRLIHGCAVPWGPCPKGGLHPSRLCKHACDAVSDSATIRRLRRTRKAASDGSGTAPCRPSRTPVNKRGSVEQAGLQNRDLRSSPGRRMPDGWTRQRPRTAVPKLQQDYRYGVSRSWVSCGWWLPLDLLRTQGWWGDTPGMSWLHAVPAVEPETTGHTPIGSGPGRSPKPGCVFCGLAIHGPGPCGAWPVPPGWA